MIFFPWLLPRHKKYSITFISFFIIIIIKMMRFFFSIFFVVLLSIYLSVRSRNKKINKILIGWFFGFFLILYSWNFTFVIIKVDLLNIANQYLNLLQSRWDLMRNFKSACQFLVEMIYSFMFLLLFLGGKLYVEFVMHGS